MRYLCVAFLVLITCGAPKQEEVTMEQKKGASMHINVKDYGEIAIQLHKKEAPENVANIVKLTNAGFYDGLIFHRVIKGFVIQGGCPRGDGTGDPGYKLDDEISPNLKHLKGTVAMANSGPNTNGSQFYICLEPLPQLDGRYTIIGQVVSGMEVVERIGEVKTGARDRPLTPVVMEKVWIVEK